MRARRSLIIAGITALTAFAAVALAEPFFFRFFSLNESGKPAQAKPPCPVMTGDPAKVLPCQSRVVRGLPPPQEAAGSDPVSRAEP